MTSISNPEHGSRGPDRTIRPSEAATDSRSSPRTPQDAPSIQGAVEMTQSEQWPRYSLLVSSCDAYSDCWPPFFTLLAKYWPGPRPRIYLNTETRAFTFPELDIECPRVSLGRSIRLAWSHRLLRCLDEIPDEIILYLQEDYFLKDAVDTATIDELVNLMIREDIGHVSLAHYGRAGNPCGHPFLSRIDRDSEYVVCAQAGLWNVSLLKSYLRRAETVWEFEWYGTRRARAREDSFYCVNDAYEQLHHRKVVPYDATGVVHGRWMRDAVEGLFRTHGIEIDYGVRGFYDPVDDSWESRSVLTRARRRLQLMVSPVGR